MALISALLGRGLQHFSEAFPGARDLSLIHI